MEELDLGIRGWMIIIGVLLILAVLLDGYRRMRSDRYGKIRMSMKMGGTVEPGFDDDADDEDFNSELPNGGARVVARSKQPQTVKKVEPQLKPTRPIVDHAEPSTQQR